MGISRKFAKSVVLTVFVLAGIIGAIWYVATPMKPGAFYEWVGAGQPGQLLRVENFSSDVPSGAKGWRILYATTRFDGTAAIASAIVMAPINNGASFPVVAWAHGTTGIQSGCAPSLTKPLANVPAVAELLAQGWAYVATDYAGLGTSGGHAYLVGADAARNVLDAVRAARQLEGVKLENRVVVWGHSQGGNTALWTGTIAPTYAPDVNLAGVAALAPASDLKGLLSSARSGMFGKIVSSYLVVAYAGFYADVKAVELVSPRTQWLVNDIASRCAIGLETLFSVAESALLPTAGVFVEDPLTGPLGARLAENSPTGPFAAPVLVAQGQTDDLVLESVQKAYVATRCEEGQNVYYHVIPDRDHISLVAPDSPLTQVLVDWTAARMVGTISASNC